MLNYCPALVHINFTFCKLPMSAMWLNYTQVVWDSNHRVSMAMSKSGLEDSK